jgi:deoxyribonuclease-4
VRLGVHIRIAGGLIKALDSAAQLGCETVQLFAGNPNSWAQKPLDPDTAAQFAAKAAGLGIHPILLHTPYLLNLASPDEGIWLRSREALADAVRRAPALGASVVVTHIGSHKQAGYEVGVRRIAEAVAYSLDASRAGHPERVEGPTIALELGSGAGTSIGSRFDEISDIIAAVGSAAKRVGVAIDTAHLWAAGYDISTATGVDAMFDHLDSRLGFAKLKVVHFNDTQVPLGSRRDRHHHIGKGLIGLAGFGAIVNHPAARDLPGIIETPAGDSLSCDRENLDTLRNLRMQASAGQTL